MKQIRGRIGLPAILVLMMCVSAGLSAEQSWKKDDRVLAEWSNNAWYSARIVASCDDGYQVLYDDGDTKCATLLELISNEVPEAGSIKKGTLVLGKWGDAFYLARVTEIDGSDYSIVYFDGDTDTLKLEGLRVLTGEIAERNEFTAGSTSESEDSGSTETSVLAPVENIVIWKRGSEWATVETDGTIWIEGSAIGEMEKDGNVWVDGSNTGELEADGEIWIEGSNKGEIESDGCLWREGSQIGEIGKDGEIYLDGSSWGVVEPFTGTFGEMRIVAAILAFFATDFGYVTSD